MTETRSTLLADKIAKARRRMPALGRALGLVWRAAPRLTALWLALLALQGLLPALTVRLTGALVNGLVAAVEAGGAWAAVQPVLLVAVAYGVVLLAMELLQGASRWLRAAQGDIVRDHIADRIHAQSAAVDMAYFDNADYFDQLSRASGEASYRPAALLDSLGRLLQNGITLAAMAAVLLRFGWWIPLALVLSTLPALAVVLRSTERQHRWRREVTPLERRRWYYDWLLTDREPAAEQRIFGLGEHFRAAYGTLSERLRRERRQLIRQESLGELAAASAALLTTAGVLLWMVRRVLLGLASLGDLAMFYQAFSQGQALTRSLLTDAGQIYGNSLFLDDLFDFLALEPAVRSPEQPEALPGGGPPGVRFTDVTFRYPLSERTALDGFNLEIAPGQVAAVVGPNGAGKSTLIKLLCRFYDPGAGRVEVGGVDLRRCDVDALRRSITVLFQQPVSYSATVAENIGLGDRAAGRAEIVAAAQAAGADEVIARLPAGDDTLLGVWFAGGTDLSQGEWQRLALARAYLRRSPILVLDEPTSAMDPWAEAEWLRRFRRLAEGRTGLIITHRFTTAMHADVIHVMDGGRIVESGTHAGLLESGGLYARSWQAQMQAAQERARPRAAPIPGVPVP